MVPALRKTKTKFVSELSAQFNMSNQFVSFHFPQFAKLIPDKYGYIMAEAGGRRKL